MFVNKFAFIKNSVNEFKAKLSLIKRNKKDFKNYRQTDFIKII